MTDTLVRVLAGPGSQDGAALVAAGIPVAPPKAWFSKDDVPDGVPLTFTTAGRVYGLLAPNNVDHVGMPGQKVRRPGSPSGYAYFTTGQVRCDDGSVVNTGRITMASGHASTAPGVTADAAAKHYDDTTVRVADVVAWDSPAGTMCAGAAVPGLTPEQMRMAMASPPSGDWRVINGKHEMVAALLVNVAGFPVPRRNDMALAASGVVPDPDPETPLIASGAPMIRIVVAAPSVESEEDTPMSDTTTEPEASEESVTAAAAPSFVKDQVVTLPTTLGPGLVASIDGDRAVVSVEVSLADLQDAGPEGRAALSASAKDKLRDNQLNAAIEEITKLREEVQTVVASAVEREQSAEAKTRGAEALTMLADLPGADAAGN